MTQRLLFAAVAIGSVGGWSVLIGGWLIYRGTFSSDDIGIRVLIGLGFVYAAIALHAWRALHIRRRPRAARKRFVWLTCVRLALCFIAADLIIEGWRGLRILGSAELVTAVLAIGLLALDRVGRKLYAKKQPFRSKASGDAD